VPIGNSAVKKSAAGDESVNVDEAARQKKYLVESGAVAPNNITLISR